MRRLKNNTQLVANDCTSAHYGHCLAFSFTHFTPTQQLDDMWHIVSFKAACPIHTHPHAHTSTCSLYACGDRLLQSRRPQLPQCLVTARTVGLKQLPRIPQPGPRAGRPRPKDLHRVCMCVCVRACVFGSCVYVRVCVHVCGRVCAHASVDVWTAASAVKQQKCPRSLVLASLCTIMNSRTLCVLVCVCVCVCVCVRAEHSSVKTHLC